MSGAVFPLGFPGIMERHGSLSSTNDRAWEILAAHGREADGAVVTAAFQEKGRGRQGRAWLAAPGSSLLMSAVFVPPTAFNLQLIPLAAGISAAGAVKRYRGVDARIKWPNDVLIEGRKLGGILVESRSYGGSLSGTVIGIGVNVKGTGETLPADVRRTAVTLEEATDTECDPAELLDLLLEELPEWLGLALSEPRIFNSEFSAFLAHRKGDKVRVSSGEETFEGLFNEVSASGELVLETPDGTRRFFQGEIVEAE